ncbi:MAG: ABC transporter permease [Emcibacteraceae bacterium]
MLIANYITSAWRNILRHKLFSIINIMGLAIGLAAVMLIALYVRYETSYDSFWKNADNIYRMQMQSEIPGLGSYSFTNVSSQTLETIKKAFPQIKYGSRIIKTQTIIQNNSDYTKENIEMVDTEISKIFDFKVISGDLNVALENSNAIILNQSMTNKYFPNTDALGKTLTLDFNFFKQDYIVSAIIEDIPPNSQIDISSMVLFNKNKWKEYTRRFENWYVPVTQTYFSLNDGVNIDQINGQMPNVLDQYFARFSALQPDNKNSDYLTFNSINIQDIHLKAEGIGEPKPRGSMANVINFSIVASFILIIASINFMNLSTARSTRRAKEVGIRKIAGANRGMLIRQFLGEAVMLTTIALLISICLVEVLLPFLSNFISAEIKLNYFSWDMLKIIIIAFSVGIVSGLYPSFVLSSYRPVQVLKSNMNGESNYASKIRLFLVVIQFSTSILLIVITTVVYSQILYTSIKDLGFKKENLILIEDTDNEKVLAKQKLLIGELKRIPGISNVTTSSFAPGRTNEIIDDFRTSEMEYGKTISINSDGIGYNFFKTYEIPLLAGREFDVNRKDKQTTLEQIRSGNGEISSIILNRASLQKFGFRSAEAAIGKTLFMKIGEADEKLERKYNIVGVVPDFHLYSLKKEIAPTVYFLMPDNGPFISLRYNGEKSSITRDVRNLWKQQLPELPFTFSYVSDLVTSQYKSEFTEAVMFAAFSGLAIFIACLGLFGLASFTAERRTKEIGIRKVFGAEVWQIVKLLVWQFSKPVLIANIIAWPIAYLTMSRWLESFVYRIDDMVIIALCLIAGLTALLIAWATVAGNSYAVARQNPIKALRYE